MPPVLPARHVRPRTFFAIFASLVVLTIGWALATPLMGVPDEPSHTIRAAAVVRGEFVGDLPADDGTFHYPTIEVPDYIKDTVHLPCFGGDPAKSADCQPDIGDSNRLVEFSSSAASNNPVYYAIVGLPTLVMKGEAALYAMRILSGIVFSLLLTVMLVALHAQSKTIWPVLGGVVAATPGVLFLGAAINPNGVEVAGAGALFAILTLIVRRDLSRSQLWIYSFALIGSTIALTSGRTVAMLWVLVVAIIVALMVPPRRLLTALRLPQIWVALVGMALTAVWVLVWMTQLSITAIDPSGAVANRAPGIKQVLVLMVENTFDSWTAWVGQFGWLDYIAPTGVQMIWRVAIVVILFGAVVLAKGRFRLAALAAIAAAVLVPAFVQGSLYNTVGWLWQGRYGVALYTVMVLAAALALDATVSPRITAALNRLVRAALVVLGIAQITTFVFVLRRYVVATQDWFAMFLNPLWHPPLTWVGVSAIYTIGIVGALVVLMRWFTRDRTYFNGFDETAIVDRADSTSTRAL